MFPTLFFCYLYSMPKGINEYLSTQTLIFPLYSAKLNGKLFVTQTGDHIAKTFIVVEMGLFALPVQILTYEQIKAKYEIKFPKTYRYDSE